MGEAMRWRIGRKVPRNIYRDNEPIAMLATPEIAAEIVADMNEVAELRDMVKYLRATMAAMVTALDTTSAKPGAGGKGEP